MDSESKVTSLLAQYRLHLDKAVGLNGNLLQHSPLPPSFRVGIVGAGMAGLYSAMLLQQNFPGVHVKVFEASERVGGTVYTHKFSPEPYQYIEMGAMRIPVVESHGPVFSLIEHLNEQFPNDPIKLIDFKNDCLEGNRVLLNNTKQKDGRVMSAAYAKNNYKELGFPEEATSDGSATEVYSRAMKSVAEALETDFESTLKRFKNMSVQSYLQNEMGWSSQKINYVEVMLMQSNLFDRGLLEQFFCIPFFPVTWKTIAGGMSKLPEMCAQSIKKRDGEILLNTKVESIIQSDQRVGIGYSQSESNDYIYEEFDAIIMAIPLPCIRLIRERPYFGIDMEQALRSSFLERAARFAMCFHTRFWERYDLKLPPSFGGMSLTDLPIRWILYPSYGIGDGGKGVLGMYLLSGDARQWHMMSKEDKIKRALHDLQLLYPEVNVAQEYAGNDPTDEEYLTQAFGVDWGGLTFYNPGQFEEFFPALAKPHGNIYFAGGHLASTFFWMISALESAQRAVRLLAVRYGIDKVNFI